MVNLHNQLQGMENTQRISCEFWEKENKTDNTVEVGWKRLNWGNEKNYLSAGNVEGSKSFFCFFCIGSSHWILVQSSPCKTREPRLQIESKEQGSIRKRLTGWKLDWSRQDGGKEASKEIVRSYSPLLLEINQPFWLIQLCDLWHRDGKFGCKNCRWMSSVYRTTITINQQSLPSVWNLPSKIKQSPN